MVVEPEILIRVVIAEYLRDCGYKVIESATAEEVFTVLGAGGTVHVVLSEVTLPGEMDGFRLAQRIREEYPDIDVILTSGAASVANKAGDLCGNGPIAKPAHPRELVQRINMLREQRMPPSKTSGTIHHIHGRPL